MSLLSPPDISLGAAQQRHKREGRGVIFARRAIFLEIVLWIRGMSLSVGSVWPFFTKLILYFISFVLNNIPMAIYWDSHCLNSSVPTKKIVH